MNSSPVMCLAKHFQHIVWDFNGTILDDAAISMALTNDLLLARGLPPVPSLDEHFRHFCFPVEQYYVKLGFDFSRERYADVAAEWSRAYRAAASSIPLCPGVRACIAALSRVGLPQTVLSASEEGLLRDQLRAHGLLAYFEAVIGRTDVHAASKIEAVLAWQAERRPGRVLMIGDSAHDASCAAQAGFSCVLIAGNAVARQRLASCGCPVFSSVFNFFEHVNEVLDE